MRKYSDHLGLPIILKTGDKDDTLNQAEAFWTRPAELKDEDYQAFYHHLTHDPDDARAWAQQGRGQHRIPPLLYLPKSAPLDTS